MKMETNFVPVAKVQPPGADGIQDLNIQTPVRPVDTLVALEVTRIMIKDERGWCSGRYEDDSGRHCITGALAKAIGSRSWEDLRAHPAYQLLLQHCPISFTPVGVNDNLGHKRVMELLDKTIAAAKIHDHYQG